MHESGLALAIAGALRERAVADRAPESRVRLVVSGGHGDVADFDAALRLHLAVADPDLDAETIEIVHLPTHRLCVACGGAFASVDDAPCPGCGGVAVAVPAPERVEIELVRPRVQSP